MRHHIMYTFYVLFGHLICSSCDLWCLCISNCCNAINYGPFCVLCCIFSLVWMVMSFASKFEFMYDLLAAYMCSLRLVVSNVPVCPVKKSLQSLHFSLYSPVCFNCRFFLYESLYWFKDFLIVLFVLLNVLYFTSLAV